MNEADGIPGDDLHLTEDELDRSDRALDKMQARRLARTAAGLDPDVYGDDDDARLKLRRR